MAYIRILLIFALLYLAVKVLGRVLFSSVRNNERSSGRDKKKDGDVTVEGNKPGKKFIPKDDGDYIDYEEVQKD